MQLFDVKPPLNVHSRDVTIGDQRGGDRISLGRLAELGPNRAVHLSMDFEHVIGIFGKRGTGKSYLLGGILEGLSWKQPQSEVAITSISRGAILFDLLNIFQWMGSGTDGSAPTTVDLFHVPGHQAPTATSQPLTIRPQDLSADDWCILFDIDGIRDPMGQCISDALFQLKSKKKFSLSDLSGGVINMGGTYAPETIRALTQRISALSHLGLFDAEGQALTILCKPRTLAVILFAGVPESIRSLYVFLVLRKVYEDRVASSQRMKEHILRGTIDQGDDLPRMWLLIDEAQNILPSRNVSYASDMLATFVREGRNFGLSLCFTSQQPSAIDKRIMSQLDTLIAFTLGSPTDLSAVKSNLKCAEPREIKLQGSQLDVSEAIRELDVGNCVVSNTDATRLLFVRVRDRKTLHGGFEA